MYFKGKRVYDDRYRVSKYGNVRDRFDQIRRRKRDERNSYRSKQQSYIPYRDFVDNYIARPLQNDLRFQAVQQLARQFYQHTGRHLSPRVRRIIRNHISITKMPRSHEAWSPYINNQFIANIDRDIKSLMSGNYMKDFSKRRKSKKY